MGIPKKYLPSKTDLRKARALHTKRTQKAQDVDEGMFSRPTRSYDVYKIDPSRFDMLGVDTPDGITKSMIDKELRKFL